MAGYSQANRPMRVDTDLEEDVLLLNGFNGHEGVSQLYGFQLDLLSIDDAIDPATVLRKPMVVTMNVADEEKRIIHGLTSRFAQLGKKHDLVVYRAEIVPWFWFLRLSRESRIYQELSVPDIIEQVFTDAGYSDFEFRLTRSYEKRTYCVQYRESHFDFVSRLMEEEGIFYFFEHTKEKHLLVLCDDNGKTQPAAATEFARFTDDASHTEDVIWALEREDSVQSGKMTVWTYDYLQPTMKLSGSLGDGEEVYDYPRWFADPDTGERIAQLLLESREAERQLLRGEGSVRGMMPGHHFTLRDHFRRDANGKYLVTQVQHYANAGDYQSWGEESTLDYTNDFRAIPHATPYRPQARTPRPVIHGSQSAIVVGPAGEEVHVDGHGRVKVQFYWDRVGKLDENSSCWVRVTTPWGGKGYGQVSIPRIGNEVIVAFEEGDPDRPIIIGSVYNADQTPPFTLPGAGIQMGMKSRSSPGGGGTSGMSVTDTKGKEMMDVRSQFDMVTTVENDQTNTINNNRTTAIAVDDTETVGANQAITVGADHTTSVGANQSLDVGANRAITVGGNQEATISGNESLTVGGNREATIGGDEKITVGGNQTTGVSSSHTINIGGDGTIDAGGTQKIVAGGDIDVDGASVKVNAGKTITLSAGGSTIEIGPGGIKIQSGSMVQVQGATIKLN